jgi:hypothetical protein
VAQRDVYLDLYRNQVGITTWIPAWRPGPDLKLGMAGRLTGGEFVFEYYVKDRGVQVPPDEQQDTGLADYEGTTDGGVDISVKAAGQTDQAFQVVAAADVAFKLTFKKSDAMAIVYRDIREQRFTDQRVLADELVKSWEGGPWPKMQLGDVVVTSLLRASYGFAFGSSTRGAEVVLRAAGNIGAPGANLGSITGEIGVAWQRATSFSALSPAGVIIGFRGLQLRQEGFFLRRTVARPVLERRRPAGEDDGLGPAGKDDELVLAREDAAMWPVL